MSDLTQFASVRDIEYLDAIKKHGSNSAAALALGVNRRSIDRAMERLKLRATQRGHDPAHDWKHVVPEGYIVKGASTFYNAEGKVAGQWVKSTIDDTRRAEMLKAATEALADEVKARAPITQAPDHTYADLLTCYPLGDPHFGLKAWGKECGDDFDLAIAERLTLSAVDRLVQASPSSETALILPLGDVFHANDQTNQTPAHRHQLDVDSRHVHVLQIGIRTFRHAIMRALEKHAKVIVRFVAGNHDPESVWALAFTVAAFFESEPRVSVDLSPAPMWYLKHGKVLLGATHGDKTKPEQLPGIMAADRAEEWGQTTHRHWLCGHVHHSSVKEYPGVTVETFRTLAAADAYASGHGYRAGRDMRAIVYHSAHGEIERHRVDVGML